jgi:MoxR-like ATPase
MPPENVEAEAERFREIWKKLRAEVAKVVVGHDEVVDQTLTSVMAGGHALLEGVPGLGKTLLVRTLAAALDLKFSRIQFTPDLMPADIVGTNVVVEDENGRKQFEFQRGPIFGNIVLADEVNRATPKTQSALLEAMQEHRVTVAGKTWTLEQPFFVLATQNPIEMEGTYPLPEAQVDRFLLKIEVKPPRKEDLIEVLSRTTGAEGGKPERAASGDDVIRMRAFVRDIPCAKPVLDYVARLVLATHPETDGAPAIARRFVRYGSSPRGAQALVLAAKVTAVSKGRLNVAYEDVAQVARAALRHRLILNFEGEAEGIRPDAIVDALLAEVPKAPEAERLLKV